MKRVFIIGCGKFGKNALARIRRLWEKAEIWLIDSQAEVMTEGDCQEASIIRVVADGPRFLFENENVIRDGDWIIPALPQHLAFSWLLLNLKSETTPVFISLPVNLGKGLPFRKSHRKNLYLSYADFVCPENCPAPDDFCYKTKKKRPLPLWKLIGLHQGLNGTIVVLESRQLAPGLGGYPFIDLRRLLKKARESSPPFYVATACRCHGVVNGLTWK